MRRAWFVLAGFMLGVVITATVTPRFGTVVVRTGPRHVTTAERELDRVIAQIDLNAVPFDRAIDDFRKLTTAKIEIDDAALNQIHFDRQTPVTMHGTEVTLGQVLDHLASHDDAQNAPIGYCVKDGRIVITSADKVAQGVTLRCYDVRDILRSPELDDDPHNGPFDASVSSSGGAAQQQHDEIRSRSLIRLIEDAIATDSWRDNGGSVGAAFCISGRLFISQTWANHHRVGELLAVLRAPGLPPPPPPLAEKPWSPIRNAWIAPAEIERHEALVRKVLPRIVFEQTPFDEAIESLRQMSGVDIRLDSKFLTGASFPQKTSVSLHLMNASLAHALDVLLSQPIGGVELGYGVEDGIVVISTREQANRLVMTRTYDVRDMIAPLGTPGREEGIDRLIRFLRNSVDTETWIDEGGTTGRIAESHGRLIITQTWQSHQKIARWLDMLHEIGWNVAAPPPSVPATSGPSTVPRSGT